MMIQKGRDIKGRFVKKHQLFIGANNGQWKGANVGMIALHNYIRRKKTKPYFCECCGSKKPIDLANISNKYKRDPADFEWLCRRCHMEKDNRLNRFFSSKSQSEASKMKKIKLDINIIKYKRFREGKSFYQIGKELGASRNTISRRLRGENLDAIQTKR